ITVAIVLSKMEAWHCVLNLIHTAETARCKILSSQCRNCAWGLHDGRFTLEAGYNDFLKGSPYSNVHE
ncbi:MAG: hypothetical protein ACR2PN_02655, partial [Luminiphilus sp.]